MLTPKELREALESRFIIGEITEQMCIEFKPKIEKRNTYKAFYENDSDTCGKSFQAVIGQDSLIRSGEFVIGGRVVRESENPSQCQQATMADMICPVCQHAVVGTGWFQCSECIRKFFTQVPSSSHASCVHFAGIVKHYSGGVSLQSMSTVIINSKRIKYEY